MSGQAVGSGPAYSIRAVLKKQGINVSRKRIKKRMRETVRVHGLRSMLARSRA